MYSLEDALSGHIVGYCIGERMTSELALLALANAITLRRPKDTICHSDSRRQFRSGTFVRTLKNNGLRGSMGRVGAAGDNAAIESFHSLKAKQRSRFQEVGISRRASNRNRYLD